MFPLRFDFRGRQSAARRAVASVRDAGASTIFNLASRLFSAHLGRSARRLLIVMLAILFSMGCERLPAGGVRSLDTTEKPMSMPTTTMEVSHPPPPLDREIPTVTETATFALG